MKYMLLMQFSVAGTDFPSIDTWSPQELKAHIEFMHQTNSELTANGELVDAQGLGGPASARIVRAGAGEPVVTDGPFPESKEFLAGFWVVDCTEERAIEIAAHVSTAPGPGGRPLNMPIEVHPILSAPEV